MSETITIRLSEEIKREIEKISESENISKSEVVRKAILNYIKIKEFKQLRAKILPYAEQEGLLTDEDVFKAIS